MIKSFDIAPIRGRPEPGSVNMTDEAWRIRGVRVDPELIECWSESSHRILIVSIHCNETTGRQ